MDPFVMDETVGSTPTASSLASSTSAFPADAANDSVATADDVDIHYSRASTIFAAVCAVLFTVVGILGKAPREREIKALITTSPLAKFAVTSSFS